MTSRNPGCPTQLAKAARASLLAGLAAGALGAGGDVLFTVDGAKGEGLGAVLARVGDVDGDGVEDIGVGVPASDTAYVYSGKDGSVLHTLTGTGGANFGASVAAAGDADGDGVADIAVGATNDSNGAATTGAVHVLSGKDGSTIASAYGDNAGDEFGSSIACVGDQDGDGLDDLVACGRKAINTGVKGSPSTGAAKLFIGNSGKVLWTLFASRSGDEFGASACRIADLDGDGYDDVAIGAPRGLDGSSVQTGWLRLVSANSGKEILKAYGDKSGDQFGAAVASPGDLDGDGTDDVLVGAPKAVDGSGNATGLVRAVDGAAGKKIWDAYGDAAADDFGASVDAGQDADGDGVVDAVAGGPAMVDGGGADTGAVRILGGADGSAIATYFGANSGDLRGAAVAYVPDLDGDSVPDVIVGSPGVDTNGTDAGSAEAIAGGAPVTGPTGSVSVAAGAAGTATRSVTLNLSWSAGDAAVTDMRFRNSTDAAWGAWTAVASTAPWTLTTGDGAKTVQAQFRDANLLESPAVSDGITLDTTAPTGSVTLAAGAAWTSTSTVAATLTYADVGGTGVARYRIRNSGGAFGAWTTAASQTPWTLAAGDGQRTVEVQYEDGVGNQSAIVSDSIGVDTALPTSGVIVAGGASVVSDRAVSLALTATDPGGSGIAEIRLRNGADQPWGAWRAFAPTLAWTLESGDGPKTVQIQSRDLAGNESAPGSDDISLDIGAPVIGSAALTEPRRYFAPAAVLAFDVVATDADGGTGVRWIRASWDGGANWTSWTAYDAAQPFVPARPALSGAGSVRFMVRDGASNTSAPTDPLPLYFLDPDAPSLGSGGKAAGAMDGFSDIDEFGVDLVAGDAITVKIKGKAAEKKQPFLLAVDLIAPDATTAVDGTPPAPLGIAGFVAPATGRYLIVVRRADGAGSPTGTYSMKVSVKAAPGSHAASGSTGSGEFSFDAAAGSAFSATLNGAGIEPATIVLSGPGGDVPVTAKAKGSKLTVTAPALTAGTGTYTLRFTAPGDVAWSWKTTLPKGSAKLTE